jgi:TRAP-type mannitol/chloroaromatic compound transport system permease small subunit
MKLLLLVDKLSTAIGHAFAWLIVALAVFITWEVGSRYVFDEPHAWAFDAQIMLYGTLFMLAGAYTLAKSGHVRGDILYGFFTPRVQAAIDLALYLLFFVPGVVALVWAGYDFAFDSWAIDEHSNVTSEGPPIYPFKTVIPVAGAVIFLQGLVEIVRCVICLVRGEWPPRELDVREVDVEELKTLIHRDDIREVDDAAAMRERSAPR